jgi:hypothetical protein
MEIYDVQHNPKADQKLLLETLTRVRNVIHDLEKQAVKVEEREQSTLR